MFGIKTRILRFVAKLRFSSFFAPTGGRSLEALPPGRKFFLDIPTYEGSGQAVHPDIFFDEAAGKYVLSFTPYPFNDDRFENPCIALSDDGIHFYEERAGLNPLARAPEKDHNDDPDISLHDGIYSILYLETVRPDYQNVVVLESTDRLNWVRKVLYHQVLAGINDIILSPAVFWCEGRCYCFFVMGNYGKGHSIRCCSGNSLAGLDFVGAVPVKIEGIPAGLMPWHLDIIADGAGAFLMLLCLVAHNKDGKGGKYFLHIARSRDLVSWRVDPTPLIRNCYRSSGFVRDGVLYVYFSSNYAADEWRTGLYKAKL